MDLVHSVPSSHREAELIMVHAKPSGLPQEVGGGTHSDSDLHHGTVALDLWWW